jgi:hypothetical protein
MNNTIALAIKRLNVGIFFTTIALSSGIAQASAFYSGDLSITLVFPSTLEADKFGFTGPVADFKNANPSTPGNKGTLTKKVDFVNDIVTATATLPHIAGFVSPDGALSGSASGTMGADLLNITGSQFSSVPAQTLTETFSGSYTYTLITTDDLFPADQANSTFWITLSVGGQVPVHETLPIGPNTDTAAKTVPFKFNVLLPANSSTLLEVDMGLAGDASSVRPPPPPPVPPLQPPAEPIYPTNPIPEPSSSSLAFVGLMGLSVAARKRAGDCLKLGRRVRP